MSGEDKETIANKFLDEAFQEIYVILESYKKVFQYKNLIEKNEMYKTLAHKISSDLDMLDDDFKKYIHTTKFFAYIQYIKIISDELHESQI